jgi:hypothetical protein
VPVVHDLFCGRLAPRAASCLAAEWCGHVDAAAALAGCSRAHCEDGAFVVPSGEPGENLRSRFGAAGAKDDRFDAFVLADTLRTDRARLRLLVPDTPATISLPRPRDRKRRPAAGRDRRLPVPLPRPRIACRAGRGRPGHPPVRHPHRSRLPVGGQPLRDAICDFAADSRHASPWAAAIYDDARARDKDHPHAVRTTARAWAHVIWRCGRDGIAYDPAKHDALQAILAR